MADQSKTMSFDLWRSLFELQRVYLENVSQISKGMAEASGFSLTNMTDVTRVSLRNMAEVSRLSMEAARVSMTGLSETARVSMRGSSVNEPLDDQVVDVAEEVLDIGKKRVVGATTRVKRVISRVPVEQKIELFDETVTVERLPPGNDPADAAALAEREYSMQDVREVPVVTKRTQLRERVILRRERTPRIETVREVLIKTDVEVDQPRQMSIVSS